MILGLAVPAGLTVAMILVLIVADVTVRVLGFPSPRFTIGVVEYALVYFTALTAPYLVRVRGHVFIEVIIGRLEGRRRRIVEVAVYLICIAATAAFAWVSVGLFFEVVNSGDIDIRGIDIPAWVIVAPLPICYLLVAVEFARFLFGRESMYGVRQSLEDTL
jgi:C4-dicarboxylate transporter DctQ subunit